MTRSNFTVFSFAGTDSIKLLLSCITGSGNYANSVDWIDFMNNVGC